MVTIVFGVGAGLSMLIAPHVGGSSAHVSHLATFIATVLTLAWILPVLPTFPRRHDRLSWMFIAASVLAALLGEVGWATELLRRQPLMTPALQDLLFLAGYLFLCAGVLVRPGIFPRDPIGRLMSVCDIFVAGGSAYILINSPWSVHEQRLLGLPFLSATSLALLTLLCLIAALHRATPRERENPRALLGLGIGLVIAESVGLSALLGGHAHLPLLSLCWPLGLLLYGVAARWDSFVVRTSGDLQELHPLPSLAGMLVPTVMLVAAMFVAAQLAILGADTHRVQVVLFSMCILLVVIMVRQVVAFEKDRQHYQELQDLYRVTAHEATTDPLTGLANQRYFRNSFDIELRRARRYGRPLAVIFADLDYFKSINDTYGHKAGDVALQTVAACLQGLARETDLLGRYGGEEFVLMLPETTLAQAETMAERLRRAVAALSIPVAHGETKRVTMSFGVAAHPETADTPDELLTSADAAMYQAKSAGRNRVMVAITPGLGKR
jgi:diguanylate cyclase (GGDEF)-like protein